MTPKLTIDKGMAATCWPLSPEEIVNLRAALIEDGCREPIIYWENAPDGSNPIIDGHNRFTLCGELKIKFPSQGMEFDSIEAAKNWMIRNQLGRRNASAAQYSYLRGQRLLTSKKPTGRPKNSSKLESFPGDTAERIAKEEGVGRSTVIRDAKFSENVDKIGESAPKVKEAILAERISKSTAADLAELPVDRLDALGKVPDSEVVQAAEEAAVKPTERMAGFVEFRGLENALKAAEKAIGTAYRKSCDVVDKVGGKPFHNQMRAEFDPMFIAVRETLHKIMAEWKTSVEVETA